VRVDAGKGQESEAEDAREERARALRGEGDQRAGRVDGVGRARDRGVSSRGERELGRCDGRGGLTDWRGGRCRRGMVL
jgi:hypothetical protein